MVTWYEVFTAYYNNGALSWRYVSCHSTREEAEGEQRRLQGNSAWIPRIEEKTAVRGADYLPGDAIVWNVYARYGVHCGDKVPKWSKGSIRPYPEYGAETTLHHAAIGVDHASLAEAEAYRQKLLREDPERPTTPDPFPQCPLLRIVGHSPLRTGGYYEEGLTYCHDFGD